MRAVLADVTAILGGIGSGKSAYIKQRLRVDKPKRLLIFDPQSEYQEFAPITGLREIFDAMRAPSWRLAYFPTAAPDRMRAEFDLLARLAYAAGRCTFIADELHLVTSPRPDKVPAGWAALVLRARHRRVVIIGASQRPAHLDKNFLGNATRIRTGRLGYGPDGETVAKAMLIRADEVAALRPLEWIERDVNTGAVTRGRLTFR